jgi:hypothetical protein
MDGYLTDPFLHNLPENLKASWLPGDSAFSDFYKSISKGWFQVAVSDESFLDFIETLRSKEPELAKSLIELMAGGKLRSVQINSEIPDELNITGIRKSVKSKISGGLNLPADTIFHDVLESTELREKVVMATLKPLFLESDLTEGKIEFLFRERSFSLNIGDTFNWARFISNYVFPFQNIIILDPYIYKDAKKIDLAGLLRVLTKESENPSIDFISIGDEEQILKVINEIKSNKDLKAEIRFYRQLSDTSNTFHKRVIWTDYWALLGERGFNFVKIKKGMGKIIKETNLYLTGKYASKRSIWHQTRDNWSSYLEEVELVNHEQF